MENWRTKKDGYKIRANKVNTSEEKNQAKEAKYDETNNL